MRLSRRVLAVAGTVIDLLGIGTAGSVAGVRPASGTGTWTAASVYPPANAARMPRTDLRKGLTWGYRRI
jgi:hypothetical protein